MRDIMTMSVLFFVSHFYRLVSFPFIIQCDISSQSSSLYVGMCALNFFRISSFVVLNFTL